MYALHYIVEWAGSLRQHARRSLNWHEIAGVICTGSISAAIGAAFLYDNVVVSLGVLGASVFNGVICYLVGLGIGRRTCVGVVHDRKQQYRFSVRDLLWLTLVVGVCLGWKVNRGHFGWQRVVDGQTASDLVRVRTDLAVSESFRNHWKESFEFITTHHQQDNTSVTPRLTDEQLGRYGWRFSAEADSFQTVSDDGRASNIEWQDVVLAFPWLSPNDLAAYRQSKRQESAQSHLRQAD
jgi:hypothetical protein